MTAAEINRGLAEALGWKVREHACGGEIELLSGPYEGAAFSPAEDTNHLRLYVLPEVERRGLWDEFVSELASPWLQNFSAMRWEAFVLTCSPSVLAAAALKVLSGEG